MNVIHGDQDRRAKTLPIKTTYVEIGTILYLAGSVFGPSLEHRRNRFTMSRRRSVVVDLTTAAHGIFLTRSTQKSVKHAES